MIGRFLAALRRKPRYHTGGIVGPAAVAPLILQKHQEYLVSKDHPIARRVSGGWQPVSDGRGPGTPPTSGSAVTRPKAEPITVHVHASGVTSFAQAQGHARKAFEAWVAENCGGDTK